MEMPENLEDLVSLIEDAADGAHEYGETLGLEQNTETKMRADKALLVGTMGDYDAKVSLGISFTAALTSSRSNAISFLMATRDYAKSFLGNKASDAWQALGWSANSLAVPGTTERLLPHVEKVKIFFTDNPTREVNTPQLTLTAARAQSLWEALDGARQARNTYESQLGTLKNTRDAAADTVRERLRGLYSELLQLIKDPMSPIWVAFGFPRPGAPAKPDAVVNTRLENLGSARLRVQCDPASRTDYYQIWLFIVGTDTRFNLMASPVEPDKILEELTVGATVKVKMRAVNESGRGAYGDEMQIVVT